MNERIRYLRDVEGITQTEFGRRIGVSRSAVMKYESGDNIPSSSTQRIICTEFGINEKWLLTGEEPMRVDRSDEDEIDAFCGDVKHLPADDPRRFIMKLLARLSDDDWIAIADIIAKTRDQE